MRTRLWSRCRYARSRISLGSSGSGCGRGRSWRAGKTTATGHSKASPVSRLEATARCGARFKAANRAVRAAVRTDRGRRTAPHRGPGPTRGDPLLAQGLQRGPVRHPRTARSAQAMPGFGCPFGTSPGWNAATTSPRRPSRSTPDCCLPAAARPVNDRGERTSDAAAHRVRAPWLRHTAPIG